MKLLEEMKKLEESMKDKLFLQDQLKQMLHKQLEGKSYFIVLDDVWEKEHLESLITAFPNQQDKRSRILVTTRNKIITKHDQFVHKMKVLDPEKSWELLLKKANIGSTNGKKCPEELESIGRQILEKCHGLPLAISVVGGLLVETHTESGWEQVLNQINIYLGRAESSVSTILELSYQNLSPQLKSCFLFLAFFKEDSTIPAKRLVNIWVGQGLIQQEGSRTIDEIGRGYLNELINRSMVQVEDLMIDDRVESCRLHDLVREVCLRKAKEEIGLEIVKRDEGITSESSNKPRHRVAYGENLEISPSNQDKYVRCLFLFHVFTPSGYWKSFQLLKTLNLDGFRSQSLPKSFRLLLGLKYLRVHRDPRYSSTVLMLPSWLDQLKKLEVLELDKEYVMFPNAVLRMERLRHFHASCVEGRPMIIENWKNIESLKAIRLEDWLECSSKLMASCHLRELAIDMEEIVDDSMLRRVRASLEEMANLVELHLSSFSMSFGFSMGRIIPHLDSLTKLELCGRKITCPKASMFPPNLSHLTLVGLYDDPTENLAKLPNLRYLCLRSLRVRIWGSWRMKVLHDGFPCLEALFLQIMKGLRGIDIEEGGMPLLKQLQIHRCPLLETQNLPKHIIISSA